MSIQKKKNSRSLDAPLLPPPSIAYTEENDEENDDEGAQLHQAIATFVQVRLKGSHALLENRCMTNDL